MHMRRLRSNWGNSTADIILTGTRLYGRNTGTALNPVFNREVCDLVYLVETRPDRISIDSFDSNYRGMHARSYAPHVKISDASITGGFDKLSDLLFEIRIMRVE